MIKNLLKMGFFKMMKFDYVRIMEIVFVAGAAAGLAVGFALGTSKSCPNEEEVPDT